jgi:2-methylcitrate dehydratase
MVAAALLDNQVMPEQYRPERINRQDVQGLLQKIRVSPSQGYSLRFPEEMPCRLLVTLRDGRILTKEKRDYEGFHTRPMGWETVVRKFEGLSAPYVNRDLREKIVDSVSRLEEIHVSDLMGLLGAVNLAEWKKG